MVKLVINPPYLIFLFLIVDTDRRCKNGKGVQVDRGPIACPNK
jgi:hypothetical protein